MQRVTQLMLVLTATGVMSGGGVVHAAAPVATITLTNGGYVPPGGGAVGTFNAGGTWQMGAGQIFSKVKVDFEEQLAGQANWVAINGNTTVASVPGAGGAGTYSVSITYTKVLNAKYRMKATLFRSGNGGAISVAASPAGNGWLDVTP